MTLVWFEPCRWCVSLT